MEKNYLWDSFGKHIRLGELIIFLILQHSLFCNKMPMKAEYFLRCVQSTTNSRTTIESIFIIKGKHYFYFSQYVLEENLPLWAKTHPTCSP